MTETNDPKRKKAKFEKDSWLDFFQDNILKLTTLPLCLSSNFPIF